MSEPDDSVADARRGQPAESSPEWDETNFVTRRREVALPAESDATAPTAPTQQPSVPASPPPPAARLMPPGRAVERSQVVQEFVDHKPSPVRPAARPPAEPISPQASAPTSAAPAPLPSQASPASAAAPALPEQPSTQPNSLPTREARPPSAAAGTPAAAMAAEMDLSPASTGGLGDLPAEPIVSLPPIIPEVAGHKLSPRTGEPARGPLIIAATASFGLSALVAMATYWWYWWQAIHITDFGTSARLIELFDPRPGSGSSVVLVCVMAVIGIIMTAGPGVAGYNTWHGAAWAKWAGVAACLTSLLAFFVINWSWLALAFAAIGAGLVWLPQSRPYFAAWREFNSPSRPDISPPSKVAYGPAPRYR